MSEVCQICDYQLNKSTRKPIKCPYCNFDACKTCCETFVLGESRVRCMNNACDREWSRPFIAASFSATFINGKLKTHREKVLFDIERALLPATQPVVERQIITENLNNKMRIITEKINDLNREKRQLQTQAWAANNTQQVVTERAEFVKACPNTECRGFLSSQWKCGVCQQWACQHCHEIKGEHRDTPHECNADTVATVSLLVSDTKNCPKCRMGIFKINGCDQMWCTQCHTAFNWRTGRVENNVHNPHYFEWLRRNGNAVPRNPGDIPCQQNELRHLTHITIQNLLRGRHVTNPYSKLCEQFLEKVVRNALHLRYAIIPNYQVGGYVNRNEGLRIMYMRNRITEEQFKIQLQRNEKRVVKHTEIHNALEILLTTITDILFRFIAHMTVAVGGRWDFDILEEIDPIVNYVNACLRDTSKTYASKLIRFNNELKQRE